MTTCCSVAKAMTSSLAISAAIRSMVTPAMTGSMAVAATIFFGQAGADILDGGLGDDFLSGGADEDVVRGSEGKDTVAGDTDQVADRYDGGAGIDTLDYSAAVHGTTIDLDARYCIRRGNRSRYDFEL